MGVAQAVAARRLAEGEQQLVTLQTRHVRERGVGPALEQDPALAQGRRRARPERRRHAGITVTSTSSISSSSGGPGGTRTARRFSPLTTDSGARSNRQLV